MKADSAEESEPAGAGAEKNVIGLTETETDPVSNTNTMLGTKKLLSSVRNLLLWLSESQPPNAKV